MSKIGDWWLLVIIIFINHYDPWLLSEQINLFSVLRKQ